MKNFGQIVKFIQHLVSEHLVIWLIALLGFSFTAAAFWVVNKQFGIQRDNEFSWVAHNRNRLLKLGFESALEPVRMTGDYVQSIESITADQFHRVVMPLLERNPGIEMIGLVVADDSSYKGSVQLQANSLPGAFSSLTFAENRGSNRFQPGYRIIPGSILSETIFKAMQTGEMTVSGRLKLSSANDDKYVIIACHPLYSGISEKSTFTPGFEQESASLSGFVVAVLKLDELAHAAISYLEPRGVDVLIQDDNADIDSRFLEYYSSRLNSAREFGEPQIQEWLMHRKNFLSEVVLMGDRKWTITAAANEHFRSAEAFEKAPVAVLFTGILLTLLLSTFLLRMKLGLQERQKIDQLLKDREQLLWQMSETVDDVYWAMPVDRSHFLYVSPAIEKLWGIQCEELYADPALFSSAIHADDRGQWLEALNNAVKGSGSMEAIYRVRRADGSQRWIRDNAFPVRDENGSIYRLVGVAEDITEKKQADDDLRDSEEKLRVIFNQSPDRIMSVNGAGKILMMNRGAALEFSGIRGEEIQSADLVPANYQQDYRQLLAQAFQKGEVGYFQYPTNDESSWLEIRIVPILEKHEVQTTMVIATDITEKRNFQAHAIRNARLATIGVLATGVAHEINNPNNAIQTGAALFSHVWEDAMPVLREYYQLQGDFSVGGLSFAEEGDALGELISEIKDNSRRIKAIVENLKRLGKNDPGDLNENVDINMVIRSASAIL